LHPLDKIQHGIGIRLPKPYAAVQVKRDNKNLIVIPNTVQLAKIDSRFAPVHGTGIEVIDQSGQSIPATGSFYISTETFDPYHLVIDWFKSNVDE
jgi:hypothetical protein